MSALLLVVIAACDGTMNPTEGGPLAQGLRITAQGSILVSASGATTTGALRVDAGSESPVLEVEFLDDAGQSVGPGDGLTMDARVHLSDLATLQVLSATEFTARLQGLAPGSTTARFTLFRNGEAEYISPPVEVAVAAPGS